MSTKSDLKLWILEALEQLGGEGSVVEVCAAVWQVHEMDLRASGSLFYTWQYDIRWAATQLRGEHKLAETSTKSGKPWKLAN